MSGHRKWSEIVARQFPEVVNARFPAGTKRRIQELADRTYMEVIADMDARDVRDMPPLLSPSVIVRRAVLDYLDKEGV